MPWYYQLVPTRQSDGSAFSLGATLYLVNCAACHGADRKGNPAGGFPALDVMPEWLTRDVILQMMKTGGGRMPAFDQIPKARQLAIIDFLFGVESSSDNRRNLNENGPPYAFRGFQRWLDEEGYPAIKPPWGTLNAVDLNTGTIKWKVPLGEYEALTKRGIPVTGTENYGGPVVTAGDIIFIGATADAKFRVFAKESGEILWEHDLPFNGNSTPSTYMANGKQYVVISAGNAKMKPVKGGTVVAFKLPD